MTWPQKPSNVVDWHLSRSWPNSGTHIEDECPCPQEPCGHVARSRVHPDCLQHRASKTIRSAHAPADCPAARLA